MDSTVRTLSSTVEPGGDAVVIAVGGVDAAYGSGEPNDVGGGATDGVDAVGSGGSGYGTADGTIARQLALTAVGGAPWGSEAGGVGATYTGSTTGTVKKRASNQGVSLCLSQQTSHASHRTYHAQVVAS
jgi:hypothetical protein